MSWEVFSDPVTSSAAASPGSSSELIPPQPELIVEEVSNVKYRPDSLDASVAAQSESTVSEGVQTSPASTQPGAIDSLDSMELNLGIVVDVFSPVQASTPADVPDKSVT